MHGIFLAAGPLLPKGMTLGEVGAVEIYPLMLELLRIEVPSPLPERHRLKSVLLCDH